MRNVVLSLVLPLMALRCFGAEYHVALTGGDANPGTAAQPFRTIQHGADIAQPGDTPKPKGVGAEWHLVKGCYRQFLTPRSGYTHFVAGAGE